MKKWNQEDLNIPDEDSGPAPITHTVTFPEHRYEVPRYRDMHGVWYPTQKPRVPAVTMPVSIAWSEEYRPTRLELEPQLVKLTPEESRKDKLEIYLDRMVWEVYPPVIPGQLVAQEFKGKVPKVNQKECQVYFIGTDESVGYDQGFREASGGSLGPFDPLDIVSDGLADVPFIPNINWPVPVIPPTVHVPDEAVPWQATPVPGKPIEYLTGLEILSDGQDDAMTTYMKCAGNAGNAGFDQGEEGHWFLAFVPPHTYIGLAVVDVHGTWWDRKPVAYDEQRTIRVFVPNSVLDERHYRPFTFKIPPMPQCPNSFNFRPKTE